jgi:hypothetical protein
MTNPLPPLPRDRRRVDAEHLNRPASFPFGGAVSGCAGDFKLQISDLKWVAWDLILEIGDLKWRLRNLHWQFQIGNGWLGISDYKL